MTKVIQMPSDREVAFYKQQADMRKAAEILKTGGLVVFPTETVYGLGGDATNPAAIAGIFAAKGRPSDNPLIVHLSNREQIEKWVTEIPPKGVKLIEQFSPGPITYVLRHRGGLANNVTAGLDTVAIRIPDHPLTLALLELADVPIAAPSANVSGRPSPTTAQHVIDDLDSKVELIIDGGSTQVGVESTVVDVTDDVPILLRPGGITLEALQAVVGEVKLDSGLDKQPRSPGMKYRHYAPKGEMWLVAGVDMVDKIKHISREKVAEGFRVGVLTTEENDGKYDGVIQVVCGRRSEPATVAHNLYDALRQFDHLGVEIILAESFPMEDLYLSVMNRLMKAADGKLIGDSDD